MEFSRFEMRKHGRRCDWFVRSCCQATCNERELKISTEFRSLWGPKKSPNLRLSNCSQFFFFFHFFFQLSLTHTHSPFRRFCVYAYIFRIYTLLSPLRQPRYFPLELFLFFSYLPFPRSQRYVSLIPSHRFLFYTRTRPNF